MKNKSRNSDSDESKQSNNKKMQKASKKTGQGQEHDKDQTSQNNKHKQSKAQQKKLKSQTGRFPEYLHQAEILKGLKSNPPTLLEGTLRINPKNYEDAFIGSPEARDQDIYIKGVVSRCRALNGDVVVVKLDSPDKWKVNRPYVKQGLTSIGKQLLPTRL